MAQERNEESFPVCLVAVQDGVLQKSPLYNTSETNLISNDGRLLTKTPTKTGLLHDFSSCIGASGIILDQRKGLVLTTLLPWTDFLQTKLKENRKIGGKSQVFGKLGCDEIAEVLNELPISVILSPTKDEQCTDLVDENFSKLTKDVKLGPSGRTGLRRDKANIHHVNAVAPELHNSAPLKRGIKERKEDHFLVCHARVVLAWQCQALRNDLQRLLPKEDGWELDYAEKSDEKERSLESRGQKNEEILDEEEERRSQKDQADILSWFVLLEVDDGLMDVRNSKKRLRITTELYMGQSVIACGTPFATLSPSVFLNSLSSGIVTQTSGQSSAGKGALVMTDARCMPGMEGGGLFVGDKRSLAAIIISPMCWKSNEWIGLTLACSMEALLESLNCIENAQNRIACKVDCLPKLFELGQSNSTTTRDPILQRCLSSVVLLRSGNVWGSGVIVNADHGLILTCRHVVTNTTSRRVSVKVNAKPWIKAEVVYMTPDLSPVDLAILQIIDLPCDINAVPLSSSCFEGMKVISVGYPLFDPSKSTVPFITAGIVSKVVTLSRRPVMIQSSCAVLPGASGGALLCATTGKLVGIIACNSKDVESGASFPHVNFSIPVDCFQRALDQYIKTGDASYFKQLESQDQSMTDIWSLKERGKYHLLPKSKL